MPDKLAVSLNALRLISERDPQSDSCGPNAPEDCEYGCIGCIARSVLKRLALGDDSPLADTNQAVRIPNENMLEYWLKDYAQFRPNWWPLIEQYLKH
jgi:hypothetical protein